MEQQAEAPQEGQTPGLVASDDAAILAEMANRGAEDPATDNNTDGGEPAEVEESSEAEEGDESEVEEETETEGEEADDDGDEEEADGESEDDSDTDAEEADTEPDLDIDTKKRLAQVQRADKRAREQLATDRQQAAQEIREAWSQVEEAQKAARIYEEAKTKALYDPAELLLAAGWSQAQLEDAARMVFAKSPRGLEDPRNRDVVARSARDQQSRLEMQQLKEQTEQLKQQLHQQNEQREIQSYLENVAMAVTEDSPLTNAQIDRAPERVMSRLHAKAEELYDATGEVPDADDVVAEYEKDLQAELDELGIDTSSIGKSRGKKKTKKKTQDAGEKKTARTLTNDISKPTRARKEPLTEDEIDAEILAEMKSRS